jgi:hypothetical protein
MYIFVYIFILQKADLVDIIRAVEKKYDHPIAILADLQVISHHCHYVIIITIIKTIIIIIIIISIITILSLFWLIYR